MIITHLKGGLGNQMFQYACGYSLGKEKNDIHKLDVSHFSKIPTNETKRSFELSQFNISSKIAKESEIKTLKRYENSITQSINNITSKIYTIFTGIYPIEKYLGKKDLYLNGYFQGEKFFIKYKEDILKEFTLKPELKTKEYKKVSEIIKKDKNSISMHIRRGDYITDAKTNKHHGVLTIEYYKEALNILNIKNPKIYVFSDDIDWVVKNFKFLPKDTYYVSKHKFSSAQEIILMSLCRHNIIANSSFSWWGAWLNENKDKKVIAPKKWTQSILFVNPEITPKDWYRV